jgi:hypothetical protein
MGDFFPQSYPALWRPAQAFTEPSKLKRFTYLLALLLFSNTLFGDKVEQGGSMKLEDE